MTRSRLLIPLAAALAVLVLTGGIWWITSAHDGPGSEAQPGSSGALDEPPCCKTEPAPNDDDPAPGSVPVDSFYRRGPTTLALNYAIGVPECYGTVTGVDVRETPDTVFVTLVHESAKTDDDVACIDLAMLKSIYAQLASPLHGRAVKDGAFRNKVVEEADAAYDEGGY